MSASDWIQEHPLLSFFGLTYAITWSLSLVTILSGMEPSWTAWGIGVLGAFSPPVAAAIVTKASGGSVKRWAKQLVAWRVHPKWYAAALGLPVVVMLGTAGLYTVLGGPTDWSSWPPIGFAQFGALLVLAIVVGGGQEEGGWRGFALPRLQDRYGALGASVILGLIWGLWHLPAFFDPTAPQSQWPMSNKLIYLPSIVAFSILLTWVYNGSGGSVLLVMIMHGAENAMTGWVPLDQEIAIIDGVLDPEIALLITVPALVMVVLAALVVTLLTGAEQLGTQAPPTPQHAGAPEEAEP